MTSLVVTPAKKGVMDNNGLGRLVPLFREDGASVRNGYTTKVIKKAGKYKQESFFLSFYNCTCLINDEELSASSSKYVDNKEQWQFIINAYINQ